MIDFQLYAPNIKSVLNISKKYSFRIIKNICHNINRNKDKKIVFIVGCQSSGTTLMSDIFDKDFHTKVYGEFSRLSNKDDHEIRLNPLDDIERQINKDKAPFIVIKPLVETQNILELLKHVSNSKAIFIYREYKDVANSNLKKFGIKNGINNLRPIVNNIHNNWRNENVSQKTRNILKMYFSEDMSPYNAAVLFWYVRNIIFFELKLNTNINVILCKYEDLVINSDKVMSDIYKFIDYRYPRKKIVGRIYNSSLDLGRNISLNGEIENLCADLLKKLDEELSIK